ncbi:hypothetical protein D9X30_4426 [Cupriavidus sp. U2]|nr:hypothetical protein D9X30_4426 [Cupriavidus sp. U2]
MPPWRFDLSAGARTCSASRAAAETSTSDAWRRKRAEVWSSWRPMAPDDIARQMQSEAAPWRQLVRRVGVYGD